ncbi:hypothetical protein ACFV4N_17875 [Actinosynnema sp. NPDC059797]
MTGVTGVNTERVTTGGVTTGGVTNGASGRAGFREAAAGAPAAG